jgi:predicted short-subunit dehydrogenase-like oxidoreductase (DUF2520 family)
LKLTNTEIAIIGAGKLAYSLADALVKSKYKIRIVVSKNLASASEYAKKFRIKKYSRTIKDIPVSTCVFFLTVPDDQISSVANQLAKLNFNFNQSVFVHFSGAKNISVMKNLLNKGGHASSFHIMQTFPSPEIVKIKNCFAAIETQSKLARKYLMELAVRLQLNAISLDSNEKVNYHLAGVFASNFLVSNLFSSDLLLKEPDKRKNSFEIVSPIVSSTLQNIKLNGIGEALSGPVRRGDFETIKIHSSYLKNFVLSNKRRTNNYLHLSYLVQSLNLIEIVRSKNGKLNLKQRQIEKFLKRELKKIAGLLKI